MIEAFAKWLFGPDIWMGGSFFMGVFLYIMNHYATSEEYWDAIPAELADFIEDYWPEL